MTGRADIRIVIVTVRFIVVVAGVFALMEVQVSTARALVFLVAALVTTGCRPLLPSIVSVPDYQSDWRLPHNDWATMKAEFDRCRGDAEKASTRYSDQQQAINTYNTLTGITGALGAGGSAAGVLDSFGSDNTNKAVAVTGAVVSAGGSILFSVLSGSQDPAKARAQYERMYLANEIAKARLRDVLACLAEIEQQPAVVQEPSDGEPPEVAKARQRYREYCTSLDADLPIPGTAVPKAADEAKPKPSNQSVALAVVGPQYQFRKISEYLQRYCKLDLPAASDGQ